MLKLVPQARLELTWPMLNEFRIAQVYFKSG
jgi:hypothetical protein